MTPTLQRHWEDVAVGDSLPPLRFPLTVYRLVMAAGGNRDYNAIHHNSETARASGAPDMYANTLFLQGMWEKLAREYVGPAGTIRKISGFRMKGFNVAGDTVVVQGRVERRWREDDDGLAELEVWSENRAGLSVGPGRIVVSLPLRVRHEGLIDTAR